MKPKGSTDYQINRKNYEQKPGFKADRQMRHANGEPVFPEINLSMILRHLWRGLCKLFVAVRYTVHRATGGLQIQWRLPWFKLGLAALAIFILTKKDIQFSINMKAPLAGVFGEAEKTGGAAVPTTQRLSMVQPLSFSESTKVSQRVASADELDVNVAREYVKRFRKVAIVEMRKYAIPASIKMAQGMLESMAGQSPAAVNQHNHFGPAFAGDQFDSAWENWRAHSLLIQREFKSLLDEGSNYKAWAKGLKKSGYSNDPEYDQKLIDVIQRYQLYLLDEEEI
ncbi:glucosaminidase domain-containing protein [Flavilitoribacter nigricans]|nr:glucosaminidase domain-containing protein [Flavilitoribacter nigricans]